MCISRFSIVVLFALLFSISTLAQSNRVNQFRSLEDRDYYDPLIAEPRAANIHVLFLGYSDEFPFSQKPGKRRVWDIGLGKEIPILTYQNNDINSVRKWKKKGLWGIGLWVPISFHMIEDFKDESNPILNTDYRFSGMVKAHIRVADNVGVGGRFQFGHESTHLGDEFTLAARQNNPDFERVNVSYEYWEFGASVEVDSAEEEHQLTLRGGSIGLFKPEKGYYSDKPLELEGRTIPRSARNLEPYIGIQYFNRKLTLPFPSGFGPFLSADMRYKTIYDYNKPNSDLKEDKQWSFNLLVGVRKIEQRSWRGVPDIYFRFYHGVNPHGQFRNQRDYTLIGLGIHVPL